MFKQMMLSVWFLAGMAFVSGYIAGDGSTFSITPKAVTIECAVRGDTGPVCRTAARVMVWQYGQLRATRIVACEAYTRAVAAGPVYDDPRKQVISEAIDNTVKTALNCRG